MRAETLIRKTTSSCPVCRAVLEASIVGRGAEVFMVKECREHGGFCYKVSGDRRFFESVLRTTNGRGPGQFVPSAPFRAKVEDARTLFIDLTDQCNLKCPVCFADANTAPRTELSKDEILQRLDLVRGRPSVSLCGGEPTLREDLFDIVSAIRSKGFVVKLISNGIKLADDRYVADLKRSGISWVMMQFDGFSDAVYLKTRGRELVSTKLRAVDNMSRHKIPMCLGGLQVKGVNDDQIHGMIELMQQNEWVKHIGFTPCSHVGRFDAPGGLPETDSLDTIRAIEEQAHGTLALDDFVTFRKVCSAIYRITGNPFFKQKSCFFQLLLFSEKEVLLPVNRYLDPDYLLAHLRSAATIFKSLDDLWQWESKAGGRYFKILTIENFRSEATIDLEDAGKCNKYYLVREGFIPICIYNTMVRKR